MNELLRSVRQFQFLRNASKFLPSVQDFFLRRLLVERNEYSSGVTIRNRNTQALCRDERCFGGNNLVAFYLAPNLQRFFFRLFFFAADERDDIVNHFRPSLEGLACSGNCLIGASQNLLDAILPQRRECRNIALNRAVRLDSNKALLCAEPLSLAGNDVQMFRVYFRNDHRHIRCEPMCRVIGNDRAFSLCIRFFEGTDFILLHVNCTEYEVYHAGNLFDISLCIQHYHVLHGFRHRGCHCPTAADSCFIGLASRTRGGCQSDNLKPRMTVQQGCKPLTNHTCCTDDTNFPLFHL